MFVSSWFISEFVREKHMYAIRLSFHHVICNGFLDIKMLKWPGCCIYFRVGLLSYK